LRFSHELYVVQARRSPAFSLTAATTAALFHLPDSQDGCRRKALRYRGAQSPRKKGFQDTLYRRRCLYSFENRRYIFRFLFSLQPAPLQLLFVRSPLHRVRQMPRSRPNRKYNHADRACRRGWGMSCRRLEQACKLFAQNAPLGFHLVNYSTY